MGDDSVHGTVSMLERVQELRAIATLEEMKKTDVYMDALKNSAKAPVSYGKALVDAPVDTLGDTARGLGGFFADIGHSIVSDDPSEDNVVKTGLGQTTAKRNFAFQLGVNPYSRYQPLQDELSEVSWTAVGGGLTVGAAFRAVKNAPGTVLTTSRMANTGRVLVRDKSPRELANHNEEALLALGMSEALVESLLSNYNYDPEAETRLVSSLEAMQGLKGLSQLASRATLADSVDAAEEVRDGVELLAAYHLDVQAGQAIVIAGAFPLLIDSSNGAHGVFPTDYVRNTPGARQDIANLTEAAKAGGYTLASVYVTGKMDAEMQQSLQQLGWARVKDYAERELRAQ